LCSHHSDEKEEKSAINTEMRNYKAGGEGSILISILNDIDFFYFNELYSPFITLAFNNTGSPYTPFCGLKRSFPQSRLRLDKAQPHFLLRTSEITS
jgi:hypothetical protein